MTNYTKTTVLGVSYIRARQLTVYNPLNAPPRLSILEEEVVTTATGDIFQRDVSSLDIDYDPAAAEIVPILDPTTGLPSGQQLTHAEIYAILYSVYFQAAIARDAALPIV
jgi:hypothetical protein